MTARRAATSGEEREKSILPLTRYAVSRPFFSLSALKRTVENENRKSSLRFPPPSPLQLAILQHCHVNKLLPVRALEVLQNLKPLTSWLGVWSVTGTTKKRNGCASCDPLQIMSL